MSENQMLKHFDSLFDTKVHEHIKLDMPLISSIVDKLCELPTVPSPECKVAMKRQVELSEKIMSLLSKEGQEIFEEYNKAKSQITTLTDEQLFCFGYIFAKEFDREGKIDKE